tara:strand:+ start:65 stop:505 length:441 start_codon:yes stop_codon:yes gene_type:complete
MKERIWLVYYWAMISYLFITLLVLIVSLLSWNDREYVDGGGSKRTLLCDIGFSHLEVCNLGANTPDFIKNANNILLFDFINYADESCYNKWRESENYLHKSCFEEGISLRRYIEIKNYYPFILVFLMTLIRFIFIGKHIWQRPESS